MEPTTLILDKLKSEMQKLAEKLAQNPPKSTQNLENKARKRKIENFEMKEVLSKCPRKELIQLTESLPISPEVIENYEIMDELSEREKFQEITPESSPRHEIILCENIFTTSFSESNITESYCGNVNMEKNSVEVEKSSEEPEKSLKEDDLEGILSEEKLKRLLNSSQLRNPLIGFTEQPILDEIKLRKQSAKLAELYPDTEIQLPKFIQNKNN